MGCGQKLDDAAAMYLTGVLEFLAKEILDHAAKQAAASHAKSLIDTHVHRALHANEELRMATRTDSKTMSEPKRQSENLTPWTMPSGLREFTNSTTDQHQCHCGESLKEVSSRHHHGRSWSCDRCRQGMRQGGHTGLSFGCNDCDYDLCRECVLQADTPSVACSSMPFPAEALFCMFCPQHIHYDDLKLMLKEEHRVVQLAEMYGSAKTGSKAKRAESLLKKVKNMVGEDNADGARSVLFKDEPALLRRVRSEEAISFELGEIPGMQPGLVLSSEQRGGLQKERGALRSQARHVRTRNYITSHLKGGSRG